MSVPVLTAVTGATWEASVVATLEREAVGIRVVRRCVDLPDLLAAAASGTARAALLSADLRRLDRDALARLAAGGVAVVGLVTPGDEDAARRLGRLGVAHVLPADAAAGDISGTVVQAVADSAELGVSTSYADPRAVLPDLPDVPGGPNLPAVVPGSGRLVAVWGPTGAPGRTTVALNLAAETARLAVPTLLADADVYGGVIAQQLGMLDESPGLAAAARLANNGSLDLPALAKVAPLLSPCLRVLTGISRADRWPELRPSALEVVWSLARSLAEVTVVDCGFALEQDEELSYDTAAPRRNGATLMTLAEADTVLVVGSADPVGVQRLVRALGELRTACPGARFRVVLNRVRRGPVGPDPAGQLSEALDRYAAVQELALVPYDQPALDVSMLQGRALVDVADTSPARAAIAALAADLLGRSPTQPRRRRFARR